MKMSFPLLTCDIPLFLSKCEFQAKTLEGVYFHPLFIPDCFSHLENVSIFPNHRAAVSEMNFPSDQICNQLKIIRRFEMYCDADGNVCLTDLLFLCRLILELTNLEEVFFCTYDWEPNEIEVAVNVNEFDFESIRSQAIERRCSANSKLKSLVVDEEWQFVCQGFEKQLKECLVRHGLVKESLVVCKRN